MIKAMAAPYVGIKFMPTGGINAKIWKIIFLSTKLYAAVEAGW